MTSESIANDKIAKLRAQLAALEAEVEVRSTSIGPSIQADGLVDEALGAISQGMLLLIYLSWCY